MKVLNLNKEQIKFLSTSIEDAKDSIFEYSVLKTIELQENTVLSDQQYEAIFELVDNYLNAKGETVETIYNI